MTTPSPLLPTCPACGEVARDPTARFCEACGASLGAVSPRIEPHGCRCAVCVADADGFCQVCGLKPARVPDMPGFEASVDGQLALASDKGRRHDTNQDAGAICRRRDGAVLLVVADGVSTSMDAEVAASSAALAAHAAFLEAGAGAATPLAEEAAACVSAASTAGLALAATADDPTDGPATTIVVAIVKSSVVGLAWIGDSRAYFVMPGVPETLLSRDDSWAMDEVASGRLTPETAMADANAHAITQWLGMPADAMRINTLDRAIPPGHSVLLCSDGLWNHHDAPGRMGRAFGLAAKSADAATACRLLVAGANAAGGHDNITVALLLAGSSSQPRFG